TLNIPVSPTLTSPASANGLTVTRSQGMAIAWNPNGSTGHVDIVLTSFADATTFGRVIFREAASAGKFTFPPHMLFRLPTGNGTSLDFQLGDQGPASSALFTASGLDIGLIQSFIDGVRLSNFTIN